jgi:hypothetical protein
MGFGLSTRFSFIGMVTWLSSVVFHDKAEPKCGPTPPLSSSFVYSNSTSDFGKRLQECTGHAPVVVDGHVVVELLRQYSASRQWVSLNSHIHGMGPVDAPFSFDERSEPVSKVVDRGVSHGRSVIRAQFVFPITNR